ncbi:MAG: type II toxin-antitoxin system RelE/ParE family toxin [Cyclobacteriaceae bacterium]|nr:type II toxin-antitoxin system RelE/ParE family toxin [Cyclobacteriaceae bacterium]
MEAAKALPVKISNQFSQDVEEVYQYGVETFGIIQTQRYEQQIWQLTERLSTDYYLFPECYHLETVSKMYRWIILDAHLLIYRVTKKEVQVLRLIHASRSITKIKASRSLRF